MEENMSGNKVKIMLLQDIFSGRHLRIPQRIGDGDLRRFGRTGGDGVMAKFLNLKSQVLFARRSMI